MDSTRAGEREIFKKTKADLEQGVSGVQKALSNPRDGLLWSSSLPLPSFTRVQEALDRCHLYLEEVESDLWKN